MPDTVVTGLRAEYRSDTPFVGSAAPRLSWRTETDAADWTQSSAEIRIERAGGSSTHTVEGRDAVLVDWPAGPLSPREEVAVSVRVTGSDGGTSAWSEPLALVGGHLGEGEWRAAWVGLDDAEQARPALVRGTLTVRGGLRRATLYATAHGAYQVHVNGAPVDDQILKPGWTSYPWHLLHETTDVTALLVEGGNAIGVDLAGAWWTERFGFREGARPHYGDRPAVALQIVLEYDDGRSETVATDGSWHATGDGPRTASGIYAGEDFDATRAIAGWADASFDDGAWSSVRVDTEEAPVPAARTAPAVRATQELPVVETITTPSGATVVDFGQNLVGRLRIRVSGPRGTVVTLKHAEVLEHGELGTRPLRAAAATDHYTLSGEGEEVWEPQFTFHGFRYAELQGWPGAFDPAAVTAVVIHSDMERTGWFESSHAQLDRLHENVVWGMRGNFLSIPTDCPQRDERLGWTGDIQVFSPTASFLYDCDGFLAGWLEDVALEQEHSGGVVPFVVPNVLGPAMPAAAWGDATCVVPTVLHARFGDLEALRRQLPAMRAWSDVLLGLAGDRLLWEDHFQFGDWLDPDASPHFPADAKVDADIVASAYLHRSVDLTARAGELVGDTATAERYRDLADRIHAAFLAEYVSESGRMVSDATTAYSVAIMFGLFRDARQEKAMGDRLAHLVRASGYRISTGFVGTPIITDALTRTGHADAAGRLLLQTENPSWLYPVTMGATTIWERWDSMLEDGTINPGEMTSFNHYALGAVADWMHRSVAGLAPEEPGYRVIRIAPVPIRGLDSASARHRTPYGDASVGWVREGGSIRIEAVVPPNSSAVVALPGADGTVEVGSGRHSWTVDDTAAAEHRSSDLSLDTPLADIIDDPEAYETVWRAIAASAPEEAATFRKHTKWTPGQALGPSVSHTAGIRPADIEAALGRLNEARR